MCEDDAVGLFTIRSRKNLIIKTLNFQKEHKNFVFDNQKTI